MTGEKMSKRNLPLSNVIYVSFRAKLYMADLESGLHYLLRVELATHKTLEGAELKTFKDFVTVCAKVYTPNL